MFIIYENWLPETNTITFRPAVFDLSQWRQQFLKHIINGKIVDLFKDGSIKQEEVGMMSGFGKNEYTYRSSNEQMTT